MNTTSTNAALTTKRLELGPWQADDAAAALTIFGSDEVSRWLTPALGPVADESTMREIIANWAVNDRDALTPVGHWTVKRREDGLLVGSITLRRMPPYEEDLELAWQFAPEHWGNGYATEAAHAVATWAFEMSAHELFAVMRPANVRAAKLAQRLGMQWVGETGQVLRHGTQRLPPSAARPDHTLSSS